MAAQQRRRRAHPGLAAALVVMAVLVAGCAPEGRDNQREASVAQDTSVAQVVAAGDIADCDSTSDEATAALLDRLPGTILALGDIAYERGSAKQFERCYAPSWGRHRNRTRPAPGNHDYKTDQAAAYFAFFGEQAGPPGKGWYSSDLGSWHLIALNSNCKKVGGCHPGSEQERWLRADLAAHPARCTLAYWHHPRFSSGEHHGSSNQVAGLWEALYDGGADVVLVGHEHNYERFAPLNASGEVDQARGMRQFVVGTGGRSLYRFGDPLPGSEVRDSTTFGVLTLQLAGRGYGWRFVPASENGLNDSGSDICR
jgi:3',5'-cyclic AMP phosphodiesterase CpdA